MILQLIQMSAFGLMLMELSNTVAQFATWLTVKVSNIIDALSKNIRSLTRYTKNIISQAGILLIATRTKLSHGMNFVRLSILPTSQILPLLLVTIWWEMARIRSLVGNSIKTWMEAPIDRELTTCWNGMSASIQIIVRTSHKVRLQAPCSITMTKLISWCKLMSTAMAISLEKNFACSSSEKLQSSAVTSLTSWLRWVKLLHKFGLIFGTGSLTRMLTRSSISKICSDITHIATSHFSWTTKIFTESCTGTSTSAVISMKSLSRRAYKSSMIPWGR